MKRFLLPIVALAFIASSMIAVAQPVPTSFQDPCLWSNKKSFSVPISTATTTQLIPPVTNAPVYICQAQIIHPGGAGTTALEYGTGTLCGTGTTLLRAAFAYNTTAGTMTFDTWPVSEITGYFAPAGSAVCALTTGSLSQVVTVTYIQTPPM